MSGVEALGVIGLISSTITIIESSRDLYDAATNTRGLHEAFRAVSLNVPLVLNILRGLRSIQERADRDQESTLDDEYRRDLEQSANSVIPVVSTCEENARKLKLILERVVPGEEASWIDRYWKAAQSIRPGKKRRVEELMKEILEKLQLLHTNHFFRAEIDSRRQDLNDAIQRLSMLPPSLPEEQYQNINYGSGSFNLHTGTGVQRNYSQSGGSNNQMFNAESQNFRFG